MQKTISITAISSISPLGNDSKSVWENYLTNEHFFVEKSFDHQIALVAVLDSDSNQLIFELKNKEIKYKSLDNSVLFAIQASREAVKKAGWKAGDAFGINIGSSRGATALFEKHFQTFPSSFALAIFHKWKKCV